MRTASTEMAAGLMAGNVFWTADLYTLTPLVGSPLYWTTYDSALAVGGHTFLAASMILGRTETRQSARLQIDTLEVELAGAAKISGTPVSLLAMQGWFDDARLKLDRLVMPSPGDVSWGVVGSWFEGRIAGVGPSPDVVRLGIKDEKESLSVMLPRFLYSLGCMHSVYDVNCGVVKASFTSTGTASGTPTTTSLHSNLTGHVNDYYNLGVAAFTGNVTPALAGVRRAVATYVQSGGVFTWALPLPIAPASGDTFAVYPGCSRRQVTCDTVFGNLVAFRGSPHVPPSTGGE